MDISTQYGSKTISIDIWSNQQVSYRLIWPLLKQNAPKAEKMQVWFEYSNIKFDLIFKSLMFFNHSKINNFQIYWYKSHHNTESLFRYFLFSAVIDNTAFFDHTVDPCDLDLQLKKLTSSRYFHYMFIYLSTKFEVCRRCTWWDINQKAYFYLKRLFLKTLFLPLAHSRACISVTNHPKYKFLVSKCSEMNVLFNDAKISKSENMSIFLKLRWVSTNWF